MVLKYLCSPIRILSNLPRVNIVFSILHVNNTPRYRRLAVRDSKPVAKSSKDRKPYSLITLKTAGRPSDSTNKK
jgi:hypothetical protein